MLLQMAKFHSFHGRVVFRVCVCVCVCVCTYIHTHHIFIYSPIDGHLGCFHVLTTVNDAAVNISVHISFQISVLFFFSDMYPGVEFQGHMVVLILVSWGTSVLFSTVALPISILPAV